MARKASGLSRRDVLRTTSGSLAGLAASGLAGASADLVEVNVGYAAASGRKAALAAAERVTRKFDSIPAVTVQLPRPGIDALVNRADVRYVEENGEMHALAQTMPWGVDRVDADVVHANGETGSGAHIAIIDTGIDSDHPDLQANLGAGKAFVNCQSGSCTYPWDDDNDHGTHCAGIAAGIDNTEGVVGVAPDATLHAVKVLDSSGSGSFSDVAAGIEWTADQGWDVASLSLGASSGSQVVKDAGVYATDNGVFLVAAAGNSGPCSDCVGYPAAYAEYMAVSSTNSSDSLSSFSSTGPEVEIAAPGSDIYSTVPGGYDTFSGTSMATPHVAGGGGQLMANGYTNADARQHLKNTAQKIGLPSAVGLLDVEYAVLGTGGGGGCTGVDASNWPAGSGYNGYEYITQVDMDGQVVKSSSTSAYYDFACSNVVTVNQGGSFTIGLDFEDDGYDSHYANVYIDWDQNGDWSTATETQIMSNVNDDTVTYTATVNVPSSATLGKTLARVRLSWNGFDGPTATDEIGEVNDFTIEVQ